MMSLWPKQEHLCHSGASLALLTITTDKHEQLCLNIVYRHRWAFLHLRSLCLGLLPGSRRPFSLVASRGKGSVASQQGRLVPFGVVGNSWLLFWLRVSHVYLGLPLSVCCGLLVRANFRLGWTFSKVKVVLQETQRCCFSRADLPCKLSGDCFEFAPFVATREGDVLCFVTPGSGKFCSFNFLGSYQHESKCQRTGISLDTTPFSWQLFGWFMTGKAFEATSDTWVPYCYHRSIKPLFASSLKTLSVEDWPYPPII